MTVNNRTKLRTETRTYGISETIASCNLMKFQEQETLADFGYEEIMSRKIETRNPIKGTTAPPHPHTYH